MITPNGWLFCRRLRTLQFGRNRGDDIALGSLGKVAAEHLFYCCPGLDGSGISLNPLTLREGTQLSDKQASFVEKIRAWQHAYIIPFRNRLPIHRLGSLVEDILQPTPDELPFMYGELFLERLYPMVEGEFGFHPQRQANNVLDSLAARQYRRRFGGGVSE